MFGLTAPRVQRAIEKLPGAARCDRYLGWREGEQPEVPPLVSGLEWRRSLTGFAAMHGSTICVEISLTECAAGPASCYDGGAAA